MEKGVVLKNYLDGTTTVDTLHFQAEQSDCKEKCCISSIVEPDQFKNREDEVPSPLKVKTDALKFLEEYYQSINGLNSPSYSKRITQVLKEIEKHGSYDLTEAELGFGTRLAWRNAPRCIGRIHWKTLQVFDCRHVTNAQQMFECCLQHIQFATNNGKIRSAISIFPPRKQKNSDFRIWNTQLIRYAGYLQSDGTVIGDPANIEVTQVAQHLGWVGKGTMFDVLPLIIQANGGQPEIFEIPKEYVLEVDIKHPKFHELNQLNLRWYAVPIVCNMALDCGGLRFTAAPFNGWYMSTEISVRNFGDKNRYNLLKKVARLLGFDTSLRTSLWKDRALIELTEATLHSYQEAGVTMVDHQSTAESFIRHFQKENKLRGGCPSDWVWIVPPISGSTCPVFHQEMLNYKLKPGYDYQVNPCKNFIKPLSQLEIHSNQHSEQVTSTIDHINLKNMAKHNVTILFASETGRAETFANNLRKLFCNTFNSNVVCMDQYKHEDLKKERCILVVASTSGNGEAPENGEEFSKFLHEKVHQSSRVVGLCFSIFGLGSRAYTNFCAFANLIEKLLNLLGGKQFYPIGYGDERNGQEEAFKNWSKGCFKAVCKLFSESDVDLPKFDLKSSIEDVQIIEHENVKETTLQKELMCFHCKDISLCKVKTVKNLQAKESSSVTDLVCFDISNNKQFSFQPGDHLGIYPCNSLKMVEKLINRATTNKFSSSTVVDIIDKKNNGFSSSDNISKIKKMLPNTLGLIFMWFKDITTPPSMLLLRAFAERCNEQRQKETLLKLANNRSFYQYWISRKYPSILQVLEEFPSVEVDLLLLISELPVLKPRYYSISSSPDLHPNEIHITVALINFVADGIYHSGVCSSWLHSRKPGDEVYCFLKSAPHFHLPSDPSAPIIMVGPGTGIAPFRSFWQQKTFDILQKKNTFGKMILFFGCRNKHLDNIFCYELEKAKSEGSLTEVFLGYSRDPEEPKTYVQQLLKANMEMVKNCILKDGGHFYVCGNVTMALSVKNILIDAIKDCFVYSHDECISPVDDLKKQGRFHEDIFLSEVDS